MELEELKKAIFEIIDTGVRLKAIEEHLKMPANSLSGMLSGSRPFPKKWIPKLEAYAKVYQTVELNNIPVNKERILTQREELDDSVMAGVQGFPALPEAEEVAIAKKMPPQGLTKAQQLRWHRENSQTLQ